VQNSWGTNWGLDGFIHLAVEGDLGVSGMNQWVNQVEVEEGVCDYNDDTWMGNDEDGWWRWDQCDSCGWWEWDEEDESEYWVDDEDECDRR